MRSPFNQSFDQPVPHRAGKHLPGMQAGSSWAEHSTDTRGAAALGLSLPQLCPWLTLIAISEHSHQDYSYKICENQTTRIMSLPAESRGVFKVDLKSLIFLNSSCSKNTNKNFGKQLLQLFMSGSKLASLDFLRGICCPYCKKV